MCAAGAMAQPLPFAPATLSQARPQLLCFLPGATLHDMLALNMCSSFACVMGRCGLRAGQNAESSLMTAELVIEALSYGVRLCP